MKVTFAGLTAAVRPLDAEARRETVPEKPFRELTVTVDEPEIPGARAMLELLVTVKSWSAKVTNAE